MDALERAAADLELPPIGGEADWLGRLNKVMADLNVQKKAVLSELDGPVEGDGYKVFETRWTKRSYSTAPILSDFGRQGWDLRDLLAAGAVKLAWQWTGLRRAAQEAGVALTVAPHEIEDDGEIISSHVGEVAQTRWKVDGK